MFRIECQIKLLNNTFEIRISFCALLNTVNELHNQNQNFDYSIKVIITLCVLRKNI